MPFFFYPEQKWASRIVARTRRRPIVVRSGIYHLRDDARVILYLLARNTIPWRDAGAFHDIGQLHSLAAVRNGAGETRCATVNRRAAPIAAALRLVSPALFVA